MGFHSPVREVSGNRQSKRAHQGERGKKIKSALNLGNCGNGISGVCICMCTLYWFSHVLNCTVTLVIRIGLCAR